MSDTPQSLPTVPLRVLRLPVVNDRPVPFCALVKDGTVDLAQTDPQKWAKCIQGELCWTCGVKLGAYRAFVLSPLFAIRRVSLQPPMHLDCAEWLAQTWPSLQEDVWVIWTTKSYRRLTNKKKALDTVLHLGPPTSVSWWSHGAEATRSQVIAYLDRAIPEAVEKLKYQQDLDLLKQQFEGFAQHIPAGIEI